MEGYAASRAVFGEGVGGETPPTCGGRGIDGGTPRGKKISPHFQQSEALIFCDVLKRYFPRKLLKYQNRDAFFDAVGLHAYSPEGM